MIFWNNYVIPKFGTYIHNHKQYTDCILAFDTETSTAFNINGEWVAQDLTKNPDIYSNAEKRTWVYIWQLAINDDIVYGRDIREFIIFWNKFIKKNPNINIVYVHNLGYDFTFLWEYFPRDTVLFCKSAHKPMKITSITFKIEMRCSYMLTNMSLEKCANEFNLSVNKLTGALNYNKIRLPNTPLTKNELMYCEYDVRVIVALIREYFLIDYGNIANIPLTQTGTVRRVVRELMNNRKFHFRDMQKCKPDLEMYIILTRLLAGGYTHLNFIYRETLLHDVDSFDKSSSYPDIMCTRKFPISPFSERKIDEPLDFSQYSYIFRIEFSKIRSRGYFTYISRHKIDRCRGGKSDNGKLHFCEYGEMWVTDIDYKLITDYYTIEQGGYIKITRVFRSFKSYLPIELINLILEKYGEKTQLKGVDEYSGIYMRSKQLINCIFGMMLTSLIHDEIPYSNEMCEFLPIKQLSDEQISDKLAESKPFLSYAWGIWVTAYGRDDVFRVLNKIGADCVYSDTDSAKIRNVNKWQWVFDEYNDHCAERIKNVCNALGIDENKFYPTDKFGKKHPLGFFEHECKYDDFISLGSKKYAFTCTKNGKRETNFVVAGLRKTYMNNGGDIQNTITSISQFKLSNKIPNGRTTHWYLNEQKPELIIDYLGNQYLIENRCGIAMANTYFTFNDDREYGNFILDMRNKYTNYFRIC